MDGRVGGKDREPGHCVSIQRSDQDIAVEALGDLPEGTFVDGELVGLDDGGRPEFNLLQHFRDQAARIHYWIFDLLCCKDRDTRVALWARFSNLPRN